jgi:two-component system sensor histidine kinase HydH
VLCTAVGWLLVRSVRLRERLTRRVALARQKTESLESLRLLGAGLAHEIRNPLGAIRGYAQLLHERAGDDEQRTATAVMLSELDRVSERLAEFLAFARQERVDLRPLDLAAVAERVVVLLRPDAEAAGIDLGLEAEGRPFECLGDGMQLQELVLNLVLNAIQACVAGDRVTLALSRRRGGVELVVRDNGKGIEPADLPRVFEPYFGTRPGGSGLGLAISRRIADSHQATIDIDSTPTVGTAVRLVLPTAGRVPASS